jgi:glycosyltransferase involved in cell wall biosynthesis
MRILDVSPQAVCPPRRGSAVRIYNLLRQLSSRHEIRQFSLSRDDTPFTLRPRFDQTQVTPTYGELRFRHPVASAANRICDRAWVSAPLLSGPSLEITRPRSLINLLRWAEVVLVEFPWQFEFCRRRTEAPLVLASHNLEALKFASWADAAGASVTRRPWVRYVARTEGNAARSARVVMAVSGAEREQYIERYGVHPERLVEIPNGADTERYGPIPPEAKPTARRRLGLPERPTVIYVGSDVPPNRRGADWVRRLAAAADRFTFLAVGKGAQLDRRPSNVICAGVVDDLRPYLEAADMALCPIEHGAGTKTKLLEYMAAGLPSIIFAPALCGLLARDGAEVLVAEPNVPALRYAIDRLADDRALAARIGRAARALVVERYDWLRIARRLDDVLSALVESELETDETDNYRARSYAPAYAAPSRLTI